jgi:hypothetical protein
MNGSTALLSNTFTSLSSAQAFFTDNSYSLGVLNGDVDLTLIYSLTSNSDAGANISYIIGFSTAPVPEPAEYLLILAGLCIIALKSRNRLLNA